MIKKQKEETCKIVKIMIKYIKFTPYSSYYAYRNRYVVRCETLYYLKSQRGKDYDKLSQDKSLSAEQVKAIALARVAARKEEAFTIRQDQD